MKRIILVVLCLISFFSSEAQIISRVINTTYTSTTDTIYPFTNNDYCYGMSEDKASLVITNPLGVNVMTVELDGNQGRKTLYLEQLPAGVYTYFVKCGEYTLTGKLMKK